MRNFLIGLPWTSTMLGWCCVGYCWVGARAGCGPAGQLRLGHARSGYLLVVCNSVCCLTLMAWVAIPCTIHSNQPPQVLGWGSVHSLTCALAALACNTAVLRMRSVWLQQLYCARTG